MAQAPRRVVVTGLGLLTPLGLDAESTWEGLIEGRSGIAPITAFDASAFECPIAGELRGFDPAQHVDPKLARRIDRSSVLAIAASKQAVQDAQLDLERQPPGSVGIVLGTGIGGAHLLIENQQLLDERGPRRVSPFMITNSLPDTASGLVAIALGAGGPNMAITAACATGGAAIGEAAEIIRRGAADVILAGGFEAPLHPIYYAGFQAMRAPRRARRPDAGLAPLRRRPQRLRDLRGRQRADSRGARPRPGARGADLRRVGGRGHGQRRLRHGGSRR